MVDTHCHLDSCREPAADLLERARQAGVRRVATVGTDAESVERSLALAREHDEVVAIVGRHPNSSAGFDEEGLDSIVRAARDPLARAIGETGLDFHRDWAPPDDQRRAFAAQIDLAVETGLPVVIHTRAAEEETFAMLRERAAGRVPVVLHCFSAPGRIDECVELGYLCSFAGNVTYPKSTGLHAAARDLPEELLLLETDAPYLAPEPRRGRPNEPANVRATAEFVARLREVSYEALEEAVERNAARLFGW